MTLCISQIHLAENTAAHSVLLLRSALIKVNAGTPTVAAVCCFSQSLGSTLGRQLSRHSSVLRFCIQQHTHTLALSCLLARKQTSTRSHTLAHIHLPASRTRTHTREKLTPYARSQSVCRPLLRKASDGMIMASRSCVFFVRCFYSFSLYISRPLQSVVRPRLARWRRLEATQALAFGTYLDLHFDSMVAIVSMRAGKVKREKDAGDK